MILLSSMGLGFVIGVLAGVVLEAELARTMRR